MHESYGRRLVEINPLVEFLEPLPSAVQGVALNNGGPAVEDGADGDFFVARRRDGGGGGDAEDLIEDGDG